MTSKPEPILFADDARGVYIPYHFATAIDRSCVEGLEPDDWLILESGPDHELYWDVWTGVCDSAVVTDRNGHSYRLYQDGDLWLIPEGMEWSDEQAGFVWPEDIQDWIDYANKLEKVLEIVAGSSTDELKKMQARKGLRIVRKI